MQSKLIGAAVFGCGVLIGWAFTADHYDRKLKDKEENADILRSKLQAAEESLIVVAPILDVADGEGVPDPTQPELDLHLNEENSPAGVSGEEDGADEEVDEVETEILRSNLQGLIDNYTADPNEVDRFAHSGYVSVLDKTPPFVISQEDFAADEEGADYDKVTLTYYPNHRILLDEDGDSIDDVAHVVGWKNLARFGDESNDADVVFIRNRRILIDYEVIKEDIAPLPIWIKYGMNREEFEVNKAAGMLRIRDEDL
jgi:hypothetical protein